MTWGRGGGTRETIQRAADQGRLLENCLLSRNEQDTTHTLYMTWHCRLPQINSGKHSCCALFILGLKQLCAMGKYCYQ